MDVFHPKGMAGVLKRLKPDVSPQALKIRLVAPVRISRAGPFVVIAEVSNLSDHEVLMLENACWLWNGRKMPTEPQPTQLKCAQEARDTMDYLLRRKKDLSGEEYATLESKYEQIQTSTSQVRLQVTKEMADELLLLGLIILVLSIQVRSTASGKSTQASGRVTLTAGAHPALPPFPPGAAPMKLLLGDTHCHSTYTWDYYFGNGSYTLSELKNLARVAGLDWLALTDHAYCLDAKRFQEQQQRVTALCDSDFAFLYGEEISCAERVRGARTYNTCHINSLMNSHFIGCDTDVFRKAYHPDSQTCLDRIRNAGGLSIINHPNWGSELLEAWNFSLQAYSDNHGETGMEIINGLWDERDAGATKRWIQRRLLNGEKVYPFAGSDTESVNKLGLCYTAAYGPELSQEAVKSALTAGRHFVTTGPSLSMWVSEKGRHLWYWMGETLVPFSSGMHVFLSYRKVPGELEIRVMAGKKGWSGEKELKVYTAADESGYFTFDLEPEEGMYVRAWCKGKKHPGYRAYTTPIWFG